MPFCRAIVVEVCRRANDVESSQCTEKWQRQLAALEALQIFAPMGHALGLSGICAELEDRCFQVIPVGSADSVPIQLKRCAQGGTCLAATVIRASFVSMA